MSPLNKNCKKNIVPIVSQISIIAPKSSKHQKNMLLKWKFLYYQVNIINSGIERFKDFRANIQKKRSIPQSLIEKLKSIYYFCGLNPT